MCMLCVCVQVKGHSLECSVNRDLPRRVKQGSKASYVRRAVLNDIKLAKGLIEYYDKKAELWQYGQDKVEAEEEGDASEEAPAPNVRHTAHTGRETAPMHVHAYMYTLSPPPAPLLPSPCPSSPLHHIPCR